MNIAIDVLAILGPDSKNRGIGNYTTSHLKKLFEEDKVNNYFLLNFYEDTCLKDILNYPDNVSEHYFYLGRDGYLGKGEKFQEIFGGIIKNFIFVNNIDIFYFTSPFDSLISYDMSWFKGLKTAATLYDIIPYIFKKKYLPNKTHYTNYLNKIEKLIQVDKLFAISNSAKEDLVNNFQVDPNKIEVIYSGTDEWFKTIKFKDTEINKVKNLYNITDDFIMCTGGDDDRKNIDGLIIAYSKMPKELISKFQLVVACKLSQASEERYYRLATENNIRDRVILTNFVPLNHLILLYNIAHIVAFPSKYEGFGLPVVEAMACGTPVLTSNNSSLGEIANGAAILVDPFDSDDISKGLVKILTETDLDDLTQKGYECIKKFTWQKVAHSTHLGLGKLEIDNNQLPISNKKIAFFTPLPPIQSGISDYSVDILNKLSNFFTIDVYIDQGYKPNINFREGISIFNHNKFESKQDEYHEVIFQMGNSEYHTYMFKYIQKYSGVVVLHDFNIHGLLYHMANKQTNMDNYKEYLSEDYDSDFVNNYIEEILKGIGTVNIFGLPTNGVVTNYAKKIIVHSDYAKKLLLEKDISRNVEKIFLYAEIKELKNKKELREKYGVHEDKIIISAFGHIHETKRIMPILKAFKQLSDRYNDILLHLVGKPSASIEDDMKQYINKNNLNSKVLITGYTELEEFEEYIDLTDICLNLRYPYNGESSASLMRILSKGKCVLVNDLGSFSEIPNNCCVKLASPENLTEETEVEMILNKLEMLILKPEKINELGDNARKYAEEYLDIDKIIDQYVSFINKPVRYEITNQTIEEMTEYIVRNYGLDNNELYEVAKTLSYCK